MSQEMYRKIRSNPKFAVLASDRSRFAWGLTAIVLAAYYAFMMVVAFAPDLLRSPLWPGATLSVGVPFGAAIIVGSWLLTGLYVRRANRTYETLNEEIIKEAR
ncbi:MAG: DUF485 domain-containing protein [Hyphomicrobiaceae bacterium]|nr:DUF485 domain-containing protein [Hyphomicrobiaceae bacterium]